MKKVSILFLLNNSKSLSYSQSYYIVLGWEPKCCGHEKFEVVKP